MMSRSASVVSEADSFFDPICSSNTACEADSHECLQARAGVLTPTCPWSDDRGEQKLSSEEMRGHHMTVIAVHFSFDDDSTHTTEQLDNFEWGPMRPIQPFLHHACWLQANMQQAANTGTQNNRMID